jgi:hypothetical protein
MRNDHKRREPVRAENPSGTRISAESPVLPGSPDSDYGTAGRVRNHRELSWQQETPDGTVAVVYIEPDDPGAAMAGMGSSEEPFDRWFRERVSDIYRFDLTEPSPPRFRPSTPASSCWL